MTSFLICIAGPTGAGKKSIASFLETCYSAELCSLPKDVVRITLSQEPVLVVQGCNNLSDLAEVQKLSIGSGRELLLIYVYAGQKIRFDRTCDSLREQRRSVPTSRQFNLGESSETANSVRRLKEEFEKLSGAVIDTGAIGLPSLLMSVEDFLIAHGVPEPIAKAS